ncbi:unnamed protein product, partial [Ectocarpus fasciculatus]
GSHPSLAPPPLAQPCGPSCSAAFHFRQRPRRARNGRSFGTNREGLDAAMRTSFCRVERAIQPALTTRHPRSGTRRADFWISAVLGMVRLARRDRRLLLTLPTPSAPAAWTRCRCRWLLTAHSSIASCGQLEESR